MDVLERLETILGQFPNIKFRRVGRILIVDPESDSGFQVCFDDTEYDYQVRFEYVAYDFDSHGVWEDCLEPIALFLWGLSDQCRLKIENLGGEPYAYDAERACQRNTA